MKQGQPHQENCHYNFKCWSCDWLLLIVCEAWSTSSGELPLLNLHLTLLITLHAPSRSQFVFITSINRLYLDKLPTPVSFIINISEYIILIIKYFQWKTLLPMTISINAPLSVYKKRLTEKEFHCSVVNLLEVIWGSWRLYEEVGGCTQGSWRLSGLI